MSARRNQFEQMTLPRAVGANDADKACIIIELKLNVLEMAPLANSDAPYSHNRPLEWEAFQSTLNTLFSVRPTRSRRFVRTLVSKLSRVPLDAPTAFTAGCGFNLI